MSRNSSIKLISGFINGIYKSAMVQLTPTDVMNAVVPNDDPISIYNKIPEEYRDHLTGFRTEGRWWYLKFESEYQIKWDAATKKYSDDAQEWCNKHTDE